MKRLRSFLLGGAVLFGAGASSAEAAWNNVFQVCCHQPTPAVSYYAPAACCPQPVAVTQYVQRSYYQPVTRYETRTYYEPVTSYQTSYYYAPVTSYRYSCYYDPCTCSYQQVATPTVSYQLRAQSCPVQSWVQRCATVPVTTQQLSYYYEPVTTWVTPTSAPVAPAAPVMPSTPPPPTASPGVSEQRIPPTPGVLEQPGRGNGNGGSSYERNYPPDSMPPASGSSIRPRPQSAPVAPPTVRLDRIVSLPPANVEGQVFRGETGQPGARLLFVSTDRQGARQTATTDPNGRFQLTLGAGEWLVYLHAADGKPVFHSKLAVRQNERCNVTLVSR